MLVEQAGHVVRVVDGDPRNLKITTPDDLTMAEHFTGLSSQVPALRIGNGYDLHRLVPGRPLILGGVTIPFEKGLEAHSDGDAICHAVTDAVLGAAGAGDIGRHFPDTDPAWKNADSIEMLRHASALVRDAGYADRQRGRRRHRAEAEAHAACRTRFAATSPARSAATRRRSA